MNDNYESFKTFTSEEANAWGITHYKNWLPKMQDKNNDPETPMEDFFRYYAQGAHHHFNSTLRLYDLNEYDFGESFFTKEMFLDGINEIKRHPINENVVVYRYIPKALIKDMLQWGNSSSVKKNAILMDRGFFSTTLCLDAVRDRDYATLHGKSLFRIFVPKDTPCVYLDLISDMNERELLFAPDIKLKVLNNHMFGKYINCVVVN